MNYKIKNMCVGNLNLPDLKMGLGEEKIVDQLTMALKDYKNRGYIDIKAAE